MRPEAGIQPTYRPLEPSGANRGLPARIELWLLGEGLDAEHHHEIEAEALATWIRSQIDPKEFRNVGILLRALTDAHLYMDAFRRSGIPFAIEGEKRFYGAPEATDMLNLLGAVADPHNEIALVGLLRSPLGGVRDRELLELARANALSPLQADGVPGSMPHVRRLYNLLLDLHKLSRRLDTDRFLDEIVSRIPVLAVEAATYRGEQAVANIRKLIRVMVQVSRNTGATFSDVLKETRRRVREQEAEGESPLADDQLNAVRILSIHKSKGLEYPVVILPDFSRKAGTEELPAVLEDWAGGRLGIHAIRAATPDWFMLAERYERKREAEWLRVLYVALTRAKQTLILSGRTKGAKGTLLGHLLEGLGSCGFRPDEAASRGVFEGPGFTLKVRTQIETEKPRAAPPPPAAEDSPDPQALRGLWRAREAEYRRGGGPWFESATADHEGLPELGSPPAAAQGRGRDRAMLLGTVCHKVLAEVDLRRPMDGLDALVAAGVRAAVPPALGMEIEVEVLEILRRFLASDSFRVIASAEEVHREVPFLVELDGRPWSGQVDVLYRRDGAWHVSDYKTDHAEGVALETFARKYETQKDVYSRAVQSSLGLPQPPRFSVVFLRHARAVDL